MPLPHFARRLLFVTLFLAFGLASLRAESTGSGKTVRLLTIGNSFSENATNYLDDLAKADGNTLILRKDNVGGASFEVHWKKVVANESNPTDKAGLYVHGKSLKEDLQSGPWDFVTIQQASIKSHDFGTYQPFAGQLRDFVKEYAPTATILIHETWEYRADDPRFAVKDAKPGEPKTQDEMYRGLAAAYAQLAQELGLRRIPVGDAFHLANRDPQWGYRVPAQPFDARSAKPGELPEQPHSLNVGWNWKKGADGQTKLTMDGHHANTAGEYLGACVWYEVLFGKSAAGTSFIPPGLDPEYAKFLQTTAHRAVSELK